MYKYSTLLLIVLLSLGMYSCKEKIPQSEIDEDIIQQYVAENNLTASRTASGLYYVIDDSGSGGHPTLSSEVSVHYTGYLLDGTVFDETDRSLSPIEFFLVQVIEGWQQGIPLFQKGGHGTLLIPSELGYGDRQVSVIPPNSVLGFDVELVDFQ